MNPILCGDSIFLRLFKLFPYYFNSLSREFCVSGQTLSDLKGRVKENRKALTGCLIVLMIGTNDFMNSVSLPYCKDQIRSIIKLLLRLRCSVVTCEIPPFAFQSLSGLQNVNIMEFNNFIQSLASITKIVKTRTVFVTGCEINKNLYCPFYSSSMRTDLIHPSEQGLVAILDLILDSLKVRSA